MRIFASPRGNALFLILIAVALFAALSYAVTQSGRGGGGIDREQAQLVAAQVLQYAENIRQAHMRLRIVNGVAQARFDVPDATEAGRVYQGSAYVSGTAAGIFNTDGGGLTYQKVPASWLHAPYAGYASVVSYHIMGLEVGGSVLGSAAADEILVISYLDQDVCAEINQRATGSRTIPVISYTGSGPGISSQNISNGTSLPSTMSTGSGTTRVVSTLPICVQSNATPDIWQLFYELQAR